MTLPQSDSFRAFGNMLSADHAKSGPIPYLWVREGHDPPLQSAFADPVPPPLPKMDGFIAEDGFSAGGVMPPPQMHGGYCSRDTRPRVSEGTPKPKSGHPGGVSLLTECAQPSNFIKKSTQ